jgi:hypothetical protein
MNQIACEEIRRGLGAAAQADHPIQPAPPLQAHVAGCATCQGALLLLAAAALDVPAPATIDCQCCLEDLPAFIERDLDDTRAAARVYPQVWWHLWTCPECAETYRLAGALLAAERRGAITAPAARAVAPAPLPQPLLHLVRDFLARALPPPARLARAMRGPNEGPVVLSSRALGAGRQLTLSVQEQPDGDWSVIVAVTPPQAGWLVLALGDTRFRTRFDAQGDAVVACVPAALLAATAGPDLVVGIEPDEAGT